MKFVGEFDFKKVALPRRYSRTLGRVVSLHKNSLTISGALADELGWKAGDRVDLLQSGKVFALERSNNGVFYLRKAGPSTSTLRLISVAMAMHIRTVTIDNGHLKAWTDRDRIIFTKEE